LKIQIVSSQNSANGSVLQLLFKIEKRELECTTYLNIMDGFQWNEIISRFPHIAEGIFEGLDDQSLTSCRLVEKSWKNVIDGRNYPWERIVKKK